MKYSFMSFSCPELTLEEMLALARRFGYDGIEPRMDAGHRHGIELTAHPTTRRMLRQMAADSAVALACLATSCKYADPATTKGQIDATCECIDLAADVGCPRLRVFGGAFPDSLSREQAIGVLAGALRAVADQAADRGVTVCLETHDYWCDPLHVAEVMKRVSHRAVGVNWDVMHPVRQANATIEHAFETLRPWIRHLHIHDGYNRPDQGGLAPIGQGDIDHRRVVQLLKAAAYDGYLSGEWINWEAYETCLPRELATMKGYEGGTR